MYIISLDVYHFETRIKIIDIYASLNLNLGDGMPHQDGIDPFVLNIMSS
jgi:hypothetical protein